ncbi:hypothetical protein CAEBREN_29361 [Caenorhabditis brenneri]|uniref:Uncharacterized protein n=1 Tax=Caenorhabditis brenneri TaxID=135651 RepID=G0NDS6_CAEBE|nr:hypothetical protein CAEBREN_29361 [Caenorhabditis brenneri]
MNRILYYGDVQSIPFYNCSWKSQEEWFEMGQKRPYLGYPITVFGIFIELLYPPILYIIFKTKLIKHACYKIIVLLALVDMTATATWCTSCACTLFLFVNRIVYITLPQYSDLIDGKLAFLSIILLILYFLFWFFLTPTVCFNSVGMAWFPDPFSEETPSEEAADYYRNTPQAWNNWIFVSTMLFLYVAYFVKVRKVARGQKSKAAAAIIVQCVIICFFNTVCALVYNSFTLITPDPWILMMGMFFY